MGSNRICEVEQNFGIDEIHAYFVHADHIGSSNIITDETGQRASLFEYKPFGQVAYADETNTYDTDKLFTGKTYDSTTGLYYYGARYYDPELGRFISADPTIQHPYDPQDFNRYAYCRNNPVKYVDPTGYGFWSWVKSFFAGFVGAVITAVLSPFITPPIAGMIGGAVAGAMISALNGGGLGGALKGALWGGAFGLVAGGMYYGLGPGLGAVFLGGMAIGGAVYAGIAGGGEGLANYGAGILGAVYGGSLGNALAGPSSSSPGTGNEFQSKLSKQEQAQIEKQLSTGQLENPGGNGRTSAPSAIRNVEKAKITTNAAANGNIGKGNNPNLSSATSKPNISNVTRVLALTYAKAELFMNRVVHAPFHFLAQMGEVFGPMETPLGAFLNQRFPTQPFTNALIEQVIGPIDNAFESSIEGWEYWVDYYQNY